MQPPLSSFPQISQRTNWLLFNYTFVNSSLPLTWRQTAIHMYSGVLINPLHANKLFKKIKLYFHFPYIRAPFIVNDRGFLPVQYNLYLCRGSVCPRGSSSHGIDQFLTEYSGCKKG